MRDLRDAVYGLAVADAMGLPVQFKERGSYHIDGMTGYGSFNLPEGSWSDDTSLTIATCKSIKDMGKVDIADIRKKFEDWLHNGAYTPYGSAYDIGNTCWDAIEDGKGQTSEWSNGNGSLMRIIPLAFVKDITDKQIAEVSAITHGHPISIYGCIAYVKIAKGLLEGRNLKECINEFVEPNSKYGRAIGIESLDEDEIKSTGYVVDTFEAAMWCLLTTSSYEECILKAVNLGSDTDTVGAVAGALAGIIYGYDAIPKEWIDALKAKDVIDDCLF